MGNKFKGIVRVKDKATYDNIQSKDQDKLYIVDEESETPITVVLGVKGSAESEYRTGNVTISKANIGLGDVDNTADTNKPVSTAQATAISQAVATETARAEGVESGLNTRLTTAEGKIPTEASSSNQLADKEWVGANAGKIDKIQMDGTDLPISSKTVNITGITAATQTAISTEATARSDADTALGSRIDSEESARSSADTTLQSNITAEATARSNADTTLTTNLGTEVSTRTSEVARLDERIDNLRALGRYLSTWNCETGLPGTYPEPSSYPYTYSYKAGDYYIISNIPTSGTKYKPNGTSITKESESASWVIGKVEETETASKNDYYIFDGSTWDLVKSTEKSIAFSSIAGDAKENLNLKGYLDGLQDSIDLKADSSTVSTHIANTNNPHSVTKAQVGLGNVNNTSDANKPISTATQTALNGKQPLLVSGTNIKTINNTSILGEGNIDTGSSSSAQCRGIFSAIPQTSAELWADTRGNKLPSNGDWLYLRRSTNYPNKTVAYKYTSGGTTHNYYAYESQIPAQISADTEPYAVQYTIYAKDSLDIGTELYIKTIPESITQCVVWFTGYSQAYASALQMFKRIVGGTLSSSKTICDELISYRGSTSEVSFNNGYPILLKSASTAVETGILTGHYGDYTVTVGVGTALAFHVPNDGTLVKIGTIAEKNQGEQIISIALVNGTLTRTLTNAYGRFNLTRNSTKDFQEIENDGSSSNTGYDPTAWQYDSILSDSITKTSEIANDSGFISANGTAILDTLQIDDGRDLYPGDNNFGQDIIKTKYFSKGISVKDTTESEYYNLSYPAKSGTISLISSSDEYTGTDNFNGHAIDIANYSKGITLTDLNAAETSYNISYPAKSGTIALTSDASPAIVDYDEELPEITSENSNNIARLDTVDVYYPKGSGIIEGHGDLEVNKAKATGNKSVSFLIDDLNTIGTEWVEGITLGNLRGTATSLFVPFWTITGIYNEEGNTYTSTFSFSKPVSKITLYVTTGFSVATGGEYKDKIPSDYNSAYITNNLTEEEIEVESAEQGQDPNDVTVEEYIIEPDEAFDEIEIIAEGGDYLPKFNLYRIEVDFEDGETVYDWNELATTGHVREQLAPVNTSLAAHTSEISSLDSRETATETDVANLQDYVGEIQFEHVYNSLPAAGPEFAMKVFRYDEHFYQCLNDSELVIAEGDFTGMTASQTELGSGTYYIVEAYWDNWIYISGSTKAYRDTNRLKLSSSSVLGYIDIVPDNSIFEEPITNVQITVTAYSSTKPSVVTVEKYDLEGETVTETYLDQEIIEAGTSSTFDIECEVTSSERLRIKSDSSSSTQDRRIYINQIKCTVGYNEYAWHDINSGGDVSNKMDKANPAGTGSLSLNREGSTTIGTNSVAVGTSTRATQSSSFASGNLSRAEGDCTHASGMNVTAAGSASHAEGKSTRVAASVVDITASNSTIINAWTSSPFTLAKGDGAHAEGVDTLPLANYAHAEGHKTRNNGTASHAEGEETRANGYASHAEGKSTQATSDYCHAEGYNTQATGPYTHTEGCSTQANSSAAHAEGWSTIASNTYAHAEGYDAKAQGSASHAEGKSTKATALGSHAGGYGSVANGNYSQAMGNYANANGRSQHVFGEYNIWDSATQYASERATYVEIVGNGTDNDNKSNARTLDWYGNEVLAGKLTVGAVATEDMDVVTKSVTNALSSSITTIEGKIPTEASSSNQLADKEYITTYTEPKDATILKQANVVNNVSSTSTTAPLSANQGKLLSDRIDNLSSVGRFLSIWNCTTGLPADNPTTMPYTYHTGDYFRVGEVGTTNYKPTGSTYTGAASTTVYTGEIATGDIWFFDGTNWALQINHLGAFVQDVKVAGTSVVSSGTASVPYAGDDTAGVIKTKADYATNVNQTGYLNASTITYAAYQSANNGMMVGKGTLDNVLDALLPKVIR